MTPIKQTIYLQEEEERYEIGHNVSWLKPQEGYFFTPEQLNQFISNVIKDTLDTAAEKVDLIETDGDPDPKSITNTFDITYKKHKV